VADDGAGLRKLGDPLGAPRRLVGDGAAQLERPVGWVDGIDVVDVVEGVPPRRVDDVGFRVSRRKPVLAEQGSLDAVVPAGHLH